MPFVDGRTIPEVLMRPGIHGRFLAHKDLGAGTVSLLMNRADPGAAVPLHVRANSFSRTPSAFAEFQATTRGTASQAIKALEAGGYLARRQSQADGRSVTLRLTRKGHEVVARDPFEALVRAVGSLDPQAQTAMHDALHRVLATLAASGAHQHFGVCRDCAHLSGEMNASPECLLLGAALEPDDAVLLCVHFQPKSERREESSPLRSTKRSHD